MASNLWTRIIPLIVLAALIVAAVAYRMSNTVPNQSRGREIVQRMSDKLGSPKALSMTTEEVRLRTPENGKPSRRAVTRKTVMRRGPDRIYSEITGDVHNQVWYDGVGITFVAHSEKVFGQARMPETMDRTLDAIHERYGVHVPLGDLLYAAPAKALIAETTTGGWMGREDLDGVRHDHVKFQDKDVTWEMWIPTSGDPLPRRFVIDFKERKAANHVEINFRDWNLAPTIADKQFEPQVPQDYEGIAMLQRASVLRNIPEDATATTGTGKP